MQRHLYARAVPLTPSVLSSFSKNWQGWLRTETGLRASAGLLAPYRGTPERTGECASQKAGNRESVQKQPHHLPSITPTGEITRNGVGAEGLGPLLSNQGKPKAISIIPQTNALPEHLISSHTDEQYFPLPLHFFFFSFKKTAIHIILGLQNKLQLAGYLRPHLWNSGTVFLHQPLHTSSL